MIDDALLAVALDIDWPLEALWRHTVGFIAMIVLFVAAIGASSKSMTVATLGGYTTFLYLAIEVENAWMTNIAYISMVLILVGLGFKLIRMEAWGE